MDPGDVVSPDAPYPNGKTQKENCGTEIGRVLLGSLPPTRGPLDRKPLVNDGFRRGGVGPRGTGRLGTPGLLS